MKKRQTKKKQSEFDSSGPIQLDRIISYLRCEDAGIKIRINKSDANQDAATKKLLSKLRKSELEMYKRMAGVGKYRPKPDRTSSKRCSKCGQVIHRGGYGSGNFPSRIDTYQPLPSIADVLRDYENRDAYANELR